jgi:hypothetical protein
MRFLFGRKDRKKIIVQIKRKIWINRNSRKLGFFIHIVHELNGESRRA